MSWVLFPVAQGQQATQEIQFVLVGLRVDRWLTPAAAGCSLGTGICTFSPGIALNPGLGLWEVIAWNPTGYSSWSAPVFFFAP